MAPSGLQRESQPALTRASLSHVWLVGEKKLAYVQGENAKTLIGPRTSTTAEQKQPSEWKGVTRVRVKQHEAFLSSIAEGGFNAFDWDRNL